MNIKNIFKGKREKLIGADLREEKLKGKKSSHSDNLDTVGWWKEIYKEVVREMNNLMKILKNL